MIAARDEGKRDMEMHTEMLNYIQVSSPARSATFSNNIIFGLVAFSDVVAIFITGIAIFGFYLDPANVSLSHYFAAMVVTSITVLTAFYFSGLYQSDSLEHPVDQLRKIVPLCTTIFAALVTLAFALNISSYFSRVWTFSWFFASLTLLCVGRAYYYFLLRKLALNGRLTRNIVIVGGGDQALKLVPALQNGGHPWIRILGIFDDRTRVAHSIGGYPRLGNLDDLIQYARQHRCDDIFIALPWNAEKRILEVVEKLKVLPTSVHLSPDLFGFNMHGREYSRYCGVPVLNLMKKPLVGWGSVLKELEDRLISAVFLAAASPLLLMIAVLIKLDSPGPVFFRQKRYGFNNQLIEVWKFRTMYVDQQDANAERLATRNDPRITRIGAFLRRTSLDEIPQFLNVLSGEMSIVGPRPHALKASAAGRLYEDVVIDYAVRHKVKPGITGWAQVNGWRGETDTEEKIAKRVEYDIYYIENWSLLLDLKIIVRTVRVFLGAPNAY